MLFKKLPFKPSGDEPHTICTSRQHIFILQLDSNAIHIFDINTGKRADSLVWGKQDRLLHIAYGKGDRLYICMRQGGTGDTVVMAKKEVKKKK